MRVDALSHALARTADVRAASWAAVEHLKAVDHRPSVYVERVGRLRCQAIEGYRQLLDGLPPWAGIIGRTYATGEPTLIPGVRESANDLTAAEGVVAKVCFPLAFNGCTAGALNVESTRPMDSDELEHIEATALALAAKIEALGGPPPESASQRLLRHSIAFANQVDTSAIERAVLSAAVDITPMRSAMLQRSGPKGPFEPVQVHGPLGPAFRQVESEATVALAALTSAGCSVYTIADRRAGQVDGAATLVLQVTGAISMAVLPAGGDCILVVADTLAVDLTMEHCELLELLVAQASACLRTAASVTALRQEAATDALTGLGHHATSTRSSPRRSSPGGGGGLVRT